ncbi:GerAB/ArcD/ProY family transporter [Jeotgalibacillus sp. ET6]|uniref:GerAB/ArcD/ProY family transporter n=1 Tax=Jeotgalibacillus sp. ET6 TaxID=3037260 RepID=UPI0024185BE7|nr:GerAB/ArcD/ProY family transporter [Jeotgalibacillus sp. ET6]MDG5473199.1 GerAB/ArcD/ProY family transporter [Jeotgalibacillus sp. ET6]
MDRSVQVVMMYILTHLGLIFFLYPSNIIESTDQGHWIPISLGIVIHIIFVLVYLKGLSFFPRRNIIMIYSSFGKVYLILFLLPIFLYFISAVTITVRAYSEILTIIFLANTPLWAVMALLLFIPFFLAIQGVQAIFRTGILVSFLFLPFLVFILIVSFQNVDASYIYPLWNNDFSFMTKQSYINSFFAISGGFLFLGFIQPEISYKHKKIVIAFAAVVPAFILSVYIPLLTFGKATAETFLFPFVLALDTITLSWIMFDRATVFFLLSLITFIMLFISLVLWKASIIIHHSLPSIKPVYIVVSLTFVIYIACLLIPNWQQVQMLFKWNSVLRFYVLLTVPLSIYFLGHLSKKKVY